MNTIKYNQLNSYFLNNDLARETAKTVFGNKQPSVYQTGFYSSPSWNWGYVIGIVGVQDDSGTKWYEVATRFGEVMAARWINIPKVSL